MCTAQTSQDFGSSPLVRFSFLKKVLKQYIWETTWTNNDQNTKYNNKQLAKSVCTHFTRSERNSTWLYMLPACKSPTSVRTEIKYQFSSKALKNLQQWNKGFVSGLSHVQMVKTCMCLGENACYRLLPTQYHIWKRKSCFTIFVIQTEEE